MRRVTSIIVLILAISLMMPARSVLAYGNGGNGNGDTTEDHEHASGGVSWTPNPNGEGVIGSSVWQGPRPAGPFQADKSIQDALEDLARGAGTEYTDKQVRENMEWARRAGLLEGIEVPPELAQFLQQKSSQVTAVKSSPPPKTATPPPQKKPTLQELYRARRAAKRARKQAQAIDILFDTLDYYNEGKKKGKTPSAQQLKAHVQKKVIKQKTKGVVDLDKPEETVSKVLDEAGKAVSNALKKYLGK
jgi:hypothetical protein